MHNARSLVHAASGLVLGPVWFAVLATFWATGLGTVATLMGLGVLWLLLVLVREFAAVEAGIAHHLLGADAHAPPRREGWALTERLRSRALWHAQLYLFLRFVPGLALQCVVVGLVVQGAALLVGPAWYWAPPEGIELGIDIDTLGEAVAFVPVGAALIVAGWWLAGPYGRWMRRVAERLLHGDEQDLPVQGIGPRLPHTITVCAGLELVCVIVWAATGTTSAWPLWTAFGLSVPIALQVALMAGTGMRVHLALALEVFGLMTFVWALAGGGYFWPVWVALGMAITVAGHLAFRRGASSAAPRIQELQRTRADVVGAQEDELRSIERDLHDGAQARLVSLAMQLGLAEERFATDPERARTLMGDAKLQAQEAIRELRHLARAIAPPILTSHGLHAAVDSLAATSPLRVVLHGGPGTPRPPAAVERAAYFVAAEALANAAKHAGAERIDITLERTGETLELTVADDGTGGANPDGPGLVGLRQRLAAVDGHLHVISPAGAGTTIRASIPCAPS